jgi:hypothetical protein
VVLPGPDYTLQSSPGGHEIEYWLFNAPTSLASIFWWLDSKYGDPYGKPGDGKDDFLLVQDYSAGDDHSADNVPLLIYELADVLNFTTVGYFPTNEYYINCVENWFE